MSSDIQFEAAIDAARLIARDSQEKFSDFASMHEAYGVLAEEVAELFEAVRLQPTNRSRPTMVRQEALDVAAVALRIAEQAGRVTR